MRARCFSVCRIDKKGGMEKNQLKNEAEWHMEKQGGTIVHQINRLAPQKPVAEQNRLPKKPIAALKVKLWKNK